MLRVATIIIAIALTAGAPSGCSVGTALSGSHNPDLGAVRIGANRGEIELHLGSPIKSTLLEDGRRADVYAYEIGNEPSAGRAAGHAVMTFSRSGSGRSSGARSRACRARSTTRPSCTTRATAWSI